MPPISTPLINILLFYIFSYNKECKIKVKCYLSFSDEETDPHLDPDPLKKMRIHDLDPHCILSELTSVDPDPLFLPCGSESGSAQKKLRIHGSGSA